MAHLTTASTMVAVGSVTFQTIRLRDYSSPAFTLIKEFPLLYGGNPHWQGSNQIIKIEGTTNFIAKSTRQVMEIWDWNDADGTAGTLLYDPFMGAGTPPAYNILSIQFVQGIRYVFLGTSDRELKIINYATKTMIATHLQPDPANFFETGPYPNGVIFDGEVSPDEKYFIIGGNTAWVRILSHCNIDDEILNPDFSCLPCTPLSQYFTNKVQCSVVNDNKIYARFTMLQNDPSTREHMVVTLRVLLEKEITQLADFELDDVDLLKLPLIINLFTIQKNVRIDIPSDIIEVVGVTALNDNQYLDVKFSIKNF